MEQKQFSELADESKKSKLSPTINALFIGFLIGIVIYSIVKNGLGFFILFPLFFAYKLARNSKKNLKRKI